MPLLFYHTKYFTFEIVAVNSLTVVSKSLSETNLVLI